MKVYRFLNWSNVDKAGSYNELHNLVQLGLISPTYSYLWPSPHIYNEGNNTFGKEHEMYKYFFASMSDALWMATLEENTDYNFLMEIDLPEELLRRYIGLGYYGPYQIEYRIPYKELFKEIAANPNNYTLQALDFYNRNLYTEDLDNTLEYKEIEALLSQVPYQGIHMDSRLSIYPLFCFEPKKVALKEIEQSCQEKYQRITKKMKSTRERRYSFEQKARQITSATNFITDYNRKYPKNELFDFSVSIIEEENEELKRILAKM